MPAAETNVGGISDSPKNESAANLETTVGKARDDYRIHLNFLPVDMGELRCVVYRRKCTSSQERRPMPQAIAHKLPVAAADEEKGLSYWVVLEDSGGFEPFDFQPEWNADVARNLIFASLRRSVESLLSPSDYRFPEKNFIEEVSL